MIYEKLLPYLLYLVIAIGIVFGIRYIGESIYNNGVEAGKAEIVKQSADMVQAYKERTDEDKANIEKQAQANIDAANHDADQSRDVAGKLYGQLDQIRSITSKAGVTVPASTTTAKAVNMLADVLRESIDRNTTLARFADSAYNAGLTCQLQYNSLRYDYETASTTYQSAAFKYKRDLH